MVRDIRPGLWFLIPLAEDSFGIGLIARSGRSGIALAYLFERVVVTPPTPHELSQLTANDAAITCRIMVNRIEEERWPSLGSTPGWNPDEWPMPTFVNLNSQLAVTYSDDEPARAIKRERRSAEELAGLGRAVILGVDGPVIALRQLFGIDAPVSVVGPRGSRTSNPALLVYDVVVALTYEGRPDCAEAVEAARDALQSDIDGALSDAGLGSVDGDLIGAGELLIYIDGPDPDLVLACIRTSLFAHSPLVPQHAILRRANGGELVAF